MAEQSQTSVAGLQEIGLVPATVNPLKTIVATPTSQFNLSDDSNGDRFMSFPSVLNSSDRLHPLTPLHGKRRSAASFVTSPPSSEPGSPRITSGIRSASNSSLKQYQEAVNNPKPSIPAAAGKSRPASFQLSREPSHSRPSTPHPHGKPSVKHLTCFWWKEKGHCRFKEADCLYSHYDTGLYADPPRQVIPGGEYHDRCCLLSHFR